MYPAETMIYKTYAFKILIGDYDKNLFLENYFLGNYTLENTRFNVFNMRYHNK